MRTLLQSFQVGAFAFLSSFLAGATIGHAHAAINGKANTSVKFVEAKGMTESNGLPPEIRLTFDLTCNQRFLQVVRHESIEPGSSEISIALGGLVTEDPSLDCSDPVREVTASAGSTYSGRAYHVTLISK